MNFTLLKIDSTMRSCGQVITCVILSINVEHIASLDGHPILVYV